MKTALTDSVSFAAMSKSIHAQVGTIDSVLDEEMLDRDSLLIVRTRCRFKNLPVPGILTVGFMPDGRIGTLLVRPDAAAAPTEYPSKFLDYQPKARFELPFRGEWWVAWGGRTLGENQHAIIRAQRFAYDLLVVRDGRTHSGEGRALTDYYCYGQPILAPAAGVVVTALDSLPDQPVGTRDAAHAAGNHVVIDHGNGEYSLLAHMQPHSLKVKARQRVKSGDVLGLAGNSGNTSEPHLHVHLMNRRGMDEPDADGLPMPFSDYVLDGKVLERGELRRFQLVKRRER
jgi:murein DD-endopeptidase MepM/ murein hydrolase activator NlpD